MLGILSKRFFLVLFAIFWLSGCKPDNLLVKLYTTDVEVSAGGEIVEVPVTAVFSLLGEDEDGSLEKAVEVTKRYLHPDTKFTQSQSEYSKKLVIK